jgi:hypothetical protein
MTFHSKHTISIHVEVVSLLVAKTMPHGYPHFVKILCCCDCSDTFVQMLQNIPVQCVSVSSTQVDDNDSQEYYPHQIAWNVVKWDLFTFASLHKWTAWLVSNHPHKFQHFSWVVLPHSAKLDREMAASLRAHVEHM